MGTCCTSETKKVSNKSKGLSIPTNNKEKLEKDHERVVIKSNYMGNVNPNLNPDEVKYQSKEDRVEKIRDGSSIREET